MTKDECKKTREMEADGFLSKPAAQHAERFHFQPPIRREKCPDPRKRASETQNRFLYAKSR